MGTLVLSPKLFGGLFRACFPSLLGPLQTLFCSLHSSISPASMIISSGVWTQNQCHSVPLHLGRACRGDATKPVLLSPIALRKSVQRGGHRGCSGKSGGAWGLLTGRGQDSLLPGLCGHCSQHPLGVELRRTGRKGPWAGGKRLKPLNKGRKLSWGGRAKQSEVMWVLCAFWG